MCRAALLPEHPACVEQRVSPRVLDGGVSSSVGRGAGGTPLVLRNIPRACEEPWRDQLCGRVLDCRLGWAHHQRARTARYRRDERQWCRRRCCWPCCDWCHCQAGCRCGSLPSLYLGIATAADRAVIELTLRCSARDGPGPPSRCRAAPWWGDSAPTSIAPVSSTSGPGPRAARTAWMTAALSAF